MHKTFSILVAAVTVAAVFPLLSSGAERWPSVAAPSVARPFLVARSSRFGQILFDGWGYALYAFTRDPRGRSACSGACAKAWPPFIVSAKPRAGKGVEAQLVGTTRRADGRLQATYRGRPLYHYVGDTAPGVIRCQNVFEHGGLWLVVRPSGALVR
jgi:predicted lipoprotein with Yx(FWY)xxD motif